MTITRNLIGTGLSGIAAQAVNGTVADSLTAAGTTQADALLLSNDLSVFATVASGAGAVLPEGGKNDTYAIVNGGANALKIYPPVGGTIAGGAVNAAYSLAAGAAISFVFQAYLTVIVSPGGSANGGNGAVVVASGKTFTVSNTITLAGTDGTTMTFPSTSATIARTDAGNTFTGAQVINASSGDALRVTNTGSGNSLVVEDSTNPDGSPFVIDGTGRIGFGSTSLSTVRFRFAGIVAGGASAYSQYSEPEIQSDVTTSSAVYASVPSTAAAAFTNANLRHFFASQGTIGAGSAVTNQAGFYAENTLTGATNNYGFYSNIAAASNRWNFYGNGTARSLLNGDLTVFGSTAIPAGGTVGTGIMVSSTANFGLFFGSGAPTLTAAKGSLYLRSDGSTTNDRAYINSDGGTTWTALTTAA